MKTPQIYGAEDCRDLLEDYFYVVVVSSDGNSLDIRIPEFMVPLITQELIDRVKECVPDAFYRVRPDLRKQ